jgi:hypothetical protein
MRSSTFLTLQTRVWCSECFSFYLTKFLLIEIVTKILATKNAVNFHCLIHRKYSCVNIDWALGQNSEYEFASINTTRSMLKTIPHTNYKSHHHHHQPNNVPTAGAQAFLVDYPQGERVITRHNPLRGPSVGCWVLTTANTALASAIARRGAIELLL